jgi:hypothetical protein
MLSPNATNAVTLNRGVGVTTTVTGNVQLDVRRCASVTVQVTDVAPTA